MRSTKVMFIGGLFRMCWIINLVTSVEANPTNTIHIVTRTLSASMVNSNFCFLCSEIKNRFFKSFNPVIFFVVSMTLLKVWLLYKIPYKSATSEMLHIQNMYLFFTALFFLSKINVTGGKFD